MPQEAEKLALQGDTLWRNGRVDEALIFYRQSLLLAPEWLEMYQRLGNLLHSLGRDRDQIELYRSAIGAGIKTVNIYGRLSEVLGKTRQYDEALAVLREAVALHPRDGRLCFSLGEALLAMGQVEEALAAFKHSAALRPGFIPALLGEGRAYMYLGDKRAAANCMQNVLRLDPHNVDALLNLARFKKYREYDGDVQAMEELLKVDTLEPIDRKRLCFTLGKVYEELQDYDKAFDRIAEGNRLHRAGYDYDPASNDFTWVLELFTEGFMNDRADCGASGPIRPVFILGMPRSGTSLVEQILSSHPLVFGGGELRFLGRIVTGVDESQSGETFAAKLAGLSCTALADLGSHYLKELEDLPGRDGLPVVTDKMPGNFTWVGLIRLLFPEARVIHCRRRPLDNCWSIYKNLFASNHDYAYDLGELGSLYVRYHELMVHWRRLLPGYMHEISYEELVADTEKEVRRLLEFCGLAWDERCLDFHRTERAVQTLSAGQVREPIYRASVRLGEKYGERLAPLIEALGDLGREP